MFARFKALWILNYCVFYYTDEIPHTFYCAIDPNLCPWEIACHQLSHEINNNIQKEDDSLCASARQKIALTLELQLFTLIDDIIAKYRYQDPVCDTLLPTIPENVALTNIPDKMIKDLNLFDYYIKMSDILIELIYMENKLLQNSDQIDLCNKVGSLNERVCQLKKRVCKRINTEPELTDQHKIEFDYNEILAEFNLNIKPLYFQRRIK